MLKNLIKGRPKKIIEGAFQGQKRFTAKLAKTMLKMKARRGYKNGGIFRCCMDSVPKFLMDSRKL